VEELGSNTNPIPSTAIAGISNSMKLCDLNPIQKFAEKTNKRVKSESCRVISDAISIKPA